MEGNNTIAVHVSNGPNQGAWSATLTLLELNPRQPSLVALDLGTGDKVGLRWIANLVSSTSGFVIQRQELPSGAPEVLSGVLSSDEHLYVDNTVQEGSSTATGWAEVTARRIG